MFNIITMETVLQKTVISLVYGVQFALYVQQWVMNVLFLKMDRSDLQKRKSVPSPFSVYCKFIIHHPSTPGPNPGLRRVSECRHVILRCTTKVGISCLYYHSVTLISGNSVGRVGKRGAPEIVLMLVFHRDYMHLRLFMKN